MQNEIFILNFNSIVHDAQVENTISIEEWIDIFTQEKVQMSSLQRLIDNEYSDQADLELLTKLATRPSHRLRCGELQFV